MIVRKTDGDGELRFAGQVAACAIDRIDNPHQLVRQTIGRVHGLLGQPAVMRECAQQHAVQDAIGGQVSFCLGLVRRFVGHGLLRSERAHDDGARFLGRRARHFEFVLPQI